MLDAMTPKERKKAIAENRPYDRITHAFGDYVWYSASRVTGVKVSDFHLDAKTQIETMIAAYRLYGWDSIGVRLNIEEVLGATFTYPEYREPFISASVNWDGDAIDSLTIGDPKKHPHLAVFWQVIDSLFEEVGDEVPITIAFRGVFSASAAAVGTEKFLRFIIRQPDYVHRVLSKVLEQEIAFVESFAGYDIQFNISDPIASGTVISPQQYCKFVKPYQTKVFDAMTRVSGVKPIYHICGNTGRILRDMVETGAGAISVDNLMDLDFVGEQLGADAMVVGNVDPSGSMLLGTPEVVRQDLRNCLKKGSKAKGGYLATFGCGLPLSTPPENLTALFDAFREYGKYPFDPDRL
ncbi:methylcobamide--CoM methyltransferase [Synergistales bacterium]|nr:methylcobamide--CoM methyltransferase [Synergistales bacterium]